MAPGPPAGHDDHVAKHESDQVLTIERTVAFTDAVVAIAMTLLILPLAELVPDAARQHEPATAIVTHNLPAIGSFLLSFVVIARYWQIHHHVFGMARTATRSLLSWNMVWLLTVVVLPFPTQMASIYGSQPFAVRFYIGVLLASSLSVAVMAVLITRADAPAADAPAADAPAADAPAADTSADRSDESVKTRRREWYVDMVRGSVTASAIVLVALIVVLVAPTVSYFALLLLLLQDIFESIYLRVRRSRASHQQRLRGR